ncbi:MAG: tRNA (adenosine(37)-N6)-threonylcarbamoyltransferase complex ATPase subunit type 1 TsaE [Candidatus Sericytochromatia bacterium]|nr:tRNA (adenosine(37)-N6)-threonylcarbamoyltransferase complex ATPase subunit type 1 TsaE [Candidatus Sericytochromatia bacterium]
MHTRRFLLPDLRATHQLGRALGQAIQLPAQIALDGDLGSGKTSLSQGIAQGLGITEHVSSPTFALIHAYPFSAGQLLHLDLYRLETQESLWDLDLEFQLQQCPTLLLVEWQSKFSEAWFLPARLQIVLEHSPTGRMAELFFDDHSLLDPDDLPDTLL